MSQPWMPLYVADYLADTRHLSLEEHGAYLLLLMTYWRNGSLPDDDERLARCCGITPAQWQHMRGTMLGLFQDGWKHKRVEAELAAGKARAASAKAKADKRWGKNAPADAAASPQHEPRTCKSQSQSYPHSGEKKEPRETRSVALASADAFNRFWNFYPHKVGKPDAARAFLKVASEIEPILDGLRLYIEGKPPDRSWLNPATFINQRRWEDRPAQNTGDQNGRQGNSVSAAADALVGIFEGRASGGRREEGQTHVRMLPAR